MTTIRLSRWHIVLPIFLWWLAALVLSAYNYNALQLQNIVCFAFLSLVPGLLTILLAKIKGLAFWGYAALAVAFSLLEIILIALLGNTFLPLIGIARPLDKPTLLVELFPAIALLIVFVWLRVKEVHFSIKRYAIFEKPRDLFFSFAPIVFVILAILGAIRLNDGGSNILTMIMLGGIGIYFIALLYYAKTLDENTIPTALFFISLALLLMTDLRGWYVTGHDIQTEYKVFELAKTGGLWNMATYQDAYNACLSITILPTVFSNLLNVPDPYIFKFFFQIFFAFCPVLVYLIGRHWTSVRISLLGAIYFVGFPTFFTDMPFLVRQEVAFLFFGLMMYIIFNESMDLAMRKWLFMLMGIGVILSHYSTTYTVLVILGLTVISRPIYLKLRSLRRPSLAAVRQTAKITFVMVATLLVLSFIWTSLITKTGGTVVNILDQTFSAIKDGFAGQNRSVDVSTLLAFTKPNQNQELTDYVAQTVGPIRNSAPAGEYYPASTYSQYPLTVVAPETVPLTGLGAFLQKFGIDASGAIALFGQVMAKLTELLVALGMIYILLPRSVIEHVDDELYLISLYCLVFIALTVAVPVLSTEYGIFRALQQSMFVIAPIIVAGSIMLGNGILAIMRPLKQYWTGETFAMVLAMLSFFYTTHFMPYLVGNTPAVLHLSNDGTYYDDYLIQEPEVAGVNWLTGIIGTASNAAAGIRITVETNKYNNFASLTTVNADADILPSVVKKDAYVFLGPITTEKDRATEIYDSDQINYQYPIQFLQENKNLIYNNGGAEVYR
jgi:uncharacterized membrane protein